ncbi:hypothetical protein AB0H86_23280 [Streptomyces sp. NPDC050997]|uniref:hypothetical protein n=1 Tax=Streptomyces sp. NPDC050997 TaxID=3155519 RepID=UPI003433E223
MTAEEAPRTGAALGFGLALVLLTGGPLTGCGDLGTPDGAAGVPGDATTGPRPGTPEATPPEVLCTRIVTYWSRRQLKDDTYGDYQSMGLSNGQYEILMDAVDAARAEWKRGDTKAAERSIDRTARTGCEKWYRNGGPGKGPWQ